MAETRAEIEIHASPGIVYNTLWDVERYPGFLTDIIDAKVKPGRSPNLQHVIQHTRIVRAVHLSFEMNGDPTNFIQWRLTDGDNYLSQHEGSWMVEPRLDGRTCAVVYRTRFEFVGAVPEAVVRRLVDFSVPTMLRQVKARAEFMARKAEAMF
ncbi:MAG: SRPBCC family protein [Myxococcales bacterium]|nr:SRPBCC family protein [Myxococcales bacterium]